MRFSTNLTQFFANSSADFSCFYESIVCESASELLEFSKFIFKCFHQMFRGSQICVECVKFAEHASHILNVPKSEKTYALEVSKTKLANCIKSVRVGELVTTTSEWSANTQTRADGASVKSQRDKTASAPMLAQT
jgi:hypothetical protein